jgi:hypothetical protein
MSQLADGGTIIKGFHDVEIHIPPVPPLHDIQGSHLPEKDQKWQRTTLPEIPVRDIEIFSGEKYKFSDLIDWESAKREEYIAQTGVDPWSLDRHGKPKVVPGIEANPGFFFEALNNFRKQELDRCNIWDTSKDRGHWVMIKGEPVWLNQFQYFYCNWWKLDTGYPEWRWTDCQRFYYWGEVFNHPRILGMCEVSKRGDGKSFRAGSVLYQVTIYTKFCHSGIQSKTDDDAEQMYQKKIVEPYKDLPDFFIPINDNPSNPKSGMSFHAPSRRGKHSTNVHRVMQRIAIRSNIDFRASVENAYDGATINGVLVRDEEGKCVSSDVSKRHKVTTDSVWRDGRKRGSIYSTTTVEEMNKGGKNFQGLWNSSDPHKLNELGETQSRLYKLFLPAYLTEYADEYGYPDEEKAKREQTIRRKSLENKPADLLKEKLQNPWNEKELFMASGVSCQYNLQVLRDRESICNDPDYNGIRVGNFVSTTGEIGGPVTFEDNELEGRWHVSWLFPDPNKANQVRAIHRGDKVTYHPMNDRAFAAGFDPTKTHANPDRRRSSAGGSILMKEDFWNIQETPNFIADYVWQPDDPEEAYIDFLLGCWYYGCRFLPENNLGINHVVKAVGCLDFIMPRPEKSYPSEQQKRYMEEMGVPASGVGNDLLLKNKKTWMHKYAYRLNHPRIIADSISFDPQYRTLYDLEVATQLTLMSAEKQNVGRSDNQIDISSIFGTFTQTG